MSKELYQAAGRYGLLKRWRPPNDPDLTAAHRDLVTARIAEYAAELLEECPPLLPAQVERIAQVLGGAA